MSPNIPRVTRELTPRTTLDSLRKMAKRWLEDIPSDSAAAARFNDVFPNHVGPPKLREVQHALAREFGLSSWAALKQEVEDLARSHADRVRLFLEKSANRYSSNPETGVWNTYEPDRPHRGQLAARLLARHPEIAKDSIHTAVAAHDIDAVRGFLAKDSSLANHQGGPDRWPPLLRLAYTRLPGAPAKAVAIARLLLDAGADPKVYWYPARDDFSVLTGVIGGGEGGEAEHPEGEAFARLLIEHGADPLDGQGLYNNSLGEDDTFWLELLWAESVKRGDQARWHVAIPDVLGPPLEYLLGNAVPNHPKRIKWLLEHGADANTANFYSKQPVIKHAVMAGRQDIIDMLVAHEATAPVLADDERFLGAVVQGEVAEIMRLAAAHPEFLQSPHPMFAAIRAKRADIVELLLDLGVSPDVADEKNFRALHQTTHSDAPDIAKLLIARGAEIDPFETLYGGSPLSHANYGGTQRMIEVIAPHSRNIRGLCFAGCIERLRELFTEDPALANTPIHAHETPLFCLPDDDTKASELVELLLSFGADVAARNAEGVTPAEAARKRGLEDAADLIDGSA